MLQTLRLTKQARLFNIIMTFWPGQVFMGKAGTWICDKHASLLMTNECTSNYTYSVRSNISD